MYRFKICTQCGSAIDRNSRYCIGCGAWQSNGTVQNTSPIMPQTMQTSSEETGVVMKLFKPVSFGQVCQKFPMPFTKKKIRSAEDKIFWNTNTTDEENTLKFLMYIFLLPLILCWYPMLFFCWLGYLVVYTGWWLISSFLGNKNGTAPTSNNQFAEKMKGALSDFAGGFKEGFKSMSDSNDDF